MTLSYVQNIVIWVLFWAVTRTEGCGGVYTTTTGEITSLHYPSVYEDDLTCTYDITPTSTTLLQLRFVDFYIEDEYDYVAVFNSSNQELVNLTGLHGDTLLPSSTSYRLVFTTDFSIVERGFKAVWSASPSSSYSANIAAYTVCNISAGFTFVETAQSAVLMETRIVTSLSNCQVLCAVVTLCSHFGFYNETFCTMYKQGASNIQLLDVWIKT